MISKTYAGERTAGLSSQAAVEAVGNRYDLILVASRRVRELKNGYKPKIDSLHSAGVTAMLEIEQGKVTRDYLLKETNVGNPRRGRKR